MKMTLRGYFQSVLLLRFGPPAGGEDDDLVHILVLVAGVGDVVFLQEPEEAEELDAVG